ncbi:MAG: hypothetical protein CVU89_09465 [Firmicutes bacterium HGW-Firmicutes-14]|jgi:uncharacterized protein YabE (DUF348 family)|nr:MAG: hypothetical protein CVU89_09465 [Firmicutes bacterium HGW-Firmicutes-14]
MQAYTSPAGTFGFWGQKKLIIWCLGVVVAAGIVLTGFFYNRYDVRIHADGKEMNIIVRGKTVADSIKKANIALGERDIVEPSLEAKLKDKMEIRITRIIQVSVTADGSSSNHWIPVGTVKDAVDSLKISLNPGDQVIPALGEHLKTGDSIEIVRISEQYVDETVKIAYKTERRSDQSMEKGITRVVRKGQEGLIQRTVKITLRNGQEVKREIIDEKTVRQPVNKIIAVGTVNVKTVSRGGTIRFSEAVSMTATGYTHTGNNTYSGIYPYRGVVAVDPKVVKLGTKVYVEGYGYATALDIGSSIKGNRIDLFFDTEKEARQWGRRTVKVYILE